METKKFEDLNKGKQIKVDLYSRPNAMNGKYRIGQLGLDNLAEIKDEDVFFLETLKMKANLADKMISEAELQGRNTSDSKVMEELGKEINDMGTPLHKSESIMTAVFSSLHLVVYYGIAIGIWGVVFGKGLITFGLCGIILGTLISLLFVGPVIAFQRTKEKVREMSFSAGAIWGNFAIIIGITGVLALVVKLVFLR